MTDSRKIEIELSKEQRQLLRCLRDSQAIGNAEAPLEEVLQYLVASICDGVRRPGAWERQCVLQIFGDWSYLPPMCAHCEFELLDEDNAGEMESKHCADCLLHLADEWEQKLLAELPGDELPPEDPRFELCDRAFKLDPDALLECFKQSGGCPKCAAAATPAPAAPAEPAAEAPAAPPAES